MGSRAFSRPNYQNYHFLMGQPETGFPYRGGLGEVTYTSTLGTLWEQNHSQTHSAPHGNQDLQPGRCHFVEFESLRPHHLMFSMHAQAHENLLKMPPCAAFFISAANSQGSRILAHPCQFAGGIFCVRHSASPPSPVFMRVVPRCWRLVGFLLGVWR